MKKSAIAAGLLAALGMTAYLLIPTRSTDVADTSLTVDLAADTGIEASGASGIDASRSAAQEALRLGAAAPVTSAHLNNVTPEDPAEFKSQLPSQTLFAPSEEARRYFAGKLTHAADVVDYIEFNRAALTNLKPRSTIALQMPDTGRKIEVTIERVQIHENGDRSWVGNVRNARGEPMQAVFTQGRFATMGEIMTPDHSYNLEARGRHAWIASVDEIRRRMPRVENDAVMPQPDTAPPPPSS